MYIIMYITSFPHSCSFERERKFSSSKYFCTISVSVLIDVERTITQKCSRTVLLFTARVSYR